jgi:malonyl-CoA/methylmalonyl-CoA synthetase
VAGVVELLASGLAHPDLGEVVVAYVVVDASAGRTREEIEANLREWAERGLAAYKRPRRYEFLPELPRNAMGKIERARLPS